jgi:hypothetical protein
MQALYYTRWFTKASISGQKKRTKQQQQQQTNKSNAYGRIRMLMKTKGQQEKYTELRSSEFRAGTQSHRERDMRNKEKDICEREREREVHCAPTKAHTEHVQTKDREGNKAA